MHIGIEAQRIFRQKKHGMDIVALELIRQLQQLDSKHRYTIFVRPGDDVCVQDSANVKVRLVKALSYPDWEQVALPLAAKQAKVDLLHCTSNTAPLFSPVPLIITLHDIIYLESLSWKGTPYQNFGNLYRRWLIPALAKKRSTQFITVSHYEQKRIVERLKLPTERVTVVYNGIADAYHNSIPVETLAHPAVAQLPERYLLFLGNLAPKKNFPKVLQAYVSYRKREVAPPLPLVIPEANPAYLQKLLKEFNGEEFYNDIKLIGYIPNTVLPAVYRKASLFLYPSLRESFGIPIIEGMASGTPVITSKTSSMPEVAAEAAYLVNPAEASEITAAIEELLTNDKLKQQLVTDGLARSLAFSWKNSAQQVIKLYEQSASAN